MLKEKTFIIFISFFSYIPFIYSHTLELSPSLYHFNYKEFNINDQLLDEENGFLPGFKIALTHKHNDESLSAHISLHKNKVDYIGQTQSGQPHNTETDTQLINIGLTLILKKLKVIPARVVLGIQHRKWDRNILTRNNILGLHEIYTWNELNAGLKFELEQNNNTLYWAELSALYTLNPDMKIYLENTSEILNLGPEPGFRINLGRKWLINKTSSYSINLFTEYWSFGRSNTIFTNDFFGSSAFITEPRSESFHTGLEFSINYNF